ncbi:DNA polymerase [Bacillus xiamenensis]|uniref:DNA polymerase n=1 Tax=Bacillus xiamenensis TaxID=1178537 RepID=UPI00028D964C|nr:DNA polymerase [Bacillus xiamenensis]EKF35841.1 DNA-directed DNA polymerase [Bacillus xiamenensis]MCW1836644.1 DNA polymerase [Bacillus xiamenensis]
MKTMHIDVETYSSVDLAKSGVYRYVEADDFEVMLFAYSVDSGPVHVIDLANGEPIPPEIEQAIFNEGVTKWAFNAQFERICLSRHFKQDLSPVDWRCTMVWSAYLGLPLSLEGAARVTGADKQKMSEGKDLIRFFSIPCRPTKANGGRTRNLKEHDPNRWNSFKAYNKRDVETEIAIQDKLSKFPMPEAEWDNYLLDQLINDRGIKLDLELVTQAIKCDDLIRGELISRMKEITKLENPNSVKQMREWLQTKGVETDSLNKAAVTHLIETNEGEIKEVLQLRKQLAKSSVKKYAAMENVVCRDGRARGLIQFYGANRTGRFAGRLIQVQNLPQNHISDLDEARALLKQGNFEALQILYESVPSVLSQLIRTAFVPIQNNRFIIVDFSAIEARVIAWLAGETWRNEVFASHGKIYEASAAQMFKVPIDEITKDSPLRQKGKIAELALGYGGSVGALKSMGATNIGLEEHELKPLVDVWRQSNSKIVKFWWDVDRAAKETVRQRKAHMTHGIKFEYQSGMLLIGLPSGRWLSYVKPRIGINSFGNESVSYEGIGATKKWERIFSYGPKFVENIVQAVSRDLLCYALQRVHDEGYRIVMHVHDEIVIEAPNDVTVEYISDLMSLSPPWAETLELRADGFDTNFYKKD